ncbi:MAG: DUF4367 domain-containing protein [Candidatus Methanoperedens sp.]
MIVMKESEIIFDIIKGGAASGILIAKKSPAPPKKMTLEKVSINGAEGKIMSGFGESKILTWNIGNLELTVSSPLSKEELVKVAGSIK